MAAMLDTQQASTSKPNAAFRVFINSTYTPSTQVFLINDK